MFLTSDKCCFSDHSPDGTPCCAAKVKLRHDLVLVQRTVTKMNVVHDLWNPSEMFDRWSEEFDSFATLG